jgi:hypothetical protein
MFRADADPIDAWRSDYRSIGLDRDFEPTRVQRSNQRVVKLEKGFPAGAHYEFCASRILSWPFLRNRICQYLGGFELSATGSVYTYEIGVAELADRCWSILFVSRPEITASESAEHRRPAGVAPFALQCVKDFFDRVAHNEA